MAHSPQPSPEDGPVNTGDLPRRLARHGASPAHSRGCGTRVVGVVRAVGVGPLPPPAEQREQREDRALNEEVEHGRGREGAQDVGDGARREVLRAEVDRRRGVPGEQLDEHRVHEVRPVGEPREGHPRRVGQERVHGASPELPARGDEHGEARGPGGAGEGQVKGVEPQGPAVGPAEVARGQRDQRRERREGEREGEAPPGARGRRGAAAGIGAGRREARGGGRVDRGEDAPAAEERGCEPDEVRWDARVGLAVRPVAVVAVVVVEDVRAQLVLDAEPDGSGGAAG